MELIKIVKSNNDSTLKYIMKNKDGFILEFSYINKSDGKDIICVPAQTMCNMGCKFCHTTDYIGKIKCLNVTTDEIVAGVEYIYDDLKLGERVLLISYMGCGEPILNKFNVIESMLKINNEFKTPYTRFAIATSLPKLNFLDFFWMVNEIKQTKLPVKFHFSLHYTFDILRKEWMKNSLDIIPSLSAMDFYKKLTGNAVEIHYALIEGVNDTEQDAILLSNFLKDRDFNVKFLFYNEKPTLDVHASNKSKLSIFKRYLDKYNIESEYYIPPGLDVGASCGQFLMDYYLEEVNGKEKEI